MTHCLGLVFFLKCCVCVYHKNKKEIHGWFEGSDVTKHEKGGCCGGAGVKRNPHKEALVLNAVSQVRFLAW